MVHLTDAFQRRGTRASTIPVRRLLLSIDSRTSSRFSLAWLFPDFIGNEKVNAQQGTTAS